MQRRHAGRRVSDATGPRCILPSLLRSGARAALQTQLCTGRCGQCCQRVAPKAESFSDFSANGQPRKAAGCAGAWDSGSCRDRRTFHSLHGLATVAVASFFAWACCRSGPCSPSAACVAGMVVLPSPPTGCQSVLPTWAKVGRPLRKDDGRLLPACLMGPRVILRLQPACRMALCPVCPLQLFAFACLCSAVSLVIGIVVANRTHTGRVFLRCPPGEV